TNNTFAGSGLTLFVGIGPPMLADGTTPNPNARGAEITNANVGVVKVTGSGGDTYALVATGTFQLVGVPNVTISGNATIQVNNTTQAIDQTLTIPGGSSSVHVLFNDGSLVTSFAGGDTSNPLNITILGQSLTGQITVDVATDTASKKVVKV